MGIEIKRFLLISMAFVVSLTLRAQKEELLPGSPFASHTYEMSWLKTSPDQKYMTFQKAYDYTHDTLALVAFNRPGRIIFHSAGVYPVSVRYSKKGYLFMGGASTAKYLKLPNLEPNVWTGLTKSFFLEKDNVLALLKDGVLSIYSEEAVLKEQISGVVAMELKNDRLFYTQQNGEKYTLMQWSPDASKLIYTASYKKMVIDYWEGDEYVIHGNNPEPGNTEVLYINLKDKKTVSLKTGDIAQLKNISEVSKLDQHRYFITLVAVEQPSIQKSTVDIWYPDDNHLGKKFQGGLVSKFLIWDPLKDEITPLDEKRFSRQMNIGNERFLLALTPEKHQDYIKENIQYDISRYDIKLQQYDELGSTGINNYVDPHGRYLLSYDTENWVLYDIDSKTKKILNLHPNMKPSFDRNSRTVLFTGSGQIVEYDILKSKFHFTALPEGTEAVLLNGNRKPVGNQNRFHRYDYDSARPLLLKITNQESSTQTLGIYQKKKFRLLYPLSADEVSLGSLMPDQKSFLYVKSNYNKPPKIMRYANGVEREVFQSNKGDKQASLLTMRKIDFTTSKGVPLKGLLYYPVEFDPQKKYPMIVGIYEMMRNQSSRYLRDGFSGRVEGMNIRYYLKRGYFVYLPDITYDSRGPGRSALDAVESSLAALETLPFIDFRRVGLMGHSHGGYETNFIATQSTKFAAYIGGAGNSDLVRSYHSFNYDYFSPFYWQFEEQQYRMYRSFAEDKNLYLDNSPIYHAEKVTSPILLWTGTEDKNIVWEQSMEFYLGLRRNNKKVIALFYKDGHSFDSRINREDLYIRISDWFDYHLKGIPKDWIQRIPQ